uniref:NADH-ubiquinone oxidoreductase chain 4 n=1 Tax=Ascoschoengastia sp. TATW-1 TaxID=436354 RepID=B3IUM6_9ACAR|nr:NADH dehydrogenase subunit 4 [Ascoschoengastia sp. TATW-1]
MEMAMFQNILLKFMRNNQSLILSNTVFILILILSLSKESVLMKVDSVSWILSLLTMFILMMIMMSSMSESFLFHVLNMFLLMTFMVKNMFLFFILFEWTVFPTFFLIISLGMSSGRLQASLFFVFYTMTFSLPFLLFVLSLNFNEGSSSMWVNYNSKISSLWGIFILMVFSSKLPIYYLHVWLPKAHVEAPLGGSMVLAAILLKLGSYGLIRMMNLFFWSIKPFKTTMFSVGLMGATLASMSCYSQNDLKRMVAFMSVSHMGVMFAGLMSFSKGGMLGTFLFMISHGLISSSLFFLVNVLYTRLFSRSLLKLKSGSSFMSFISFFSFILLVSNLALPPTMSFLSEIYLIWSMVSYSYMSSIFIFLIIVFSSAYTIHFFMSTNHGNDSIESMMNSGKSQEIMSMFSHFLPLLLIIVLMS